MLHALRGWIRPMLLVAVAGMLGCAPDKSSNMTERQDAAMRNPFGYSPDMSRTDVTGGGVSNFNQNAVGKDLNDVFNP
jgi:hypothetical protein